MLQLLLRHNYSNRLVHVGFQVLHVCLIDITTISSTKRGTGILTDRDAHTCAQTDRHTHTLLNDGFPHLIDEEPGMLV